MKPGYYDRDDVKSELRLSFAKLIATWRPGPLDVTSYVWKWAAKLTALRLNREIASIVYDLAEELNPDEEPGRDLRDRPSPEEKRINRERAREAYDHMSDEDKSIADEIMEGRSYAEIGRKRGMSDMEVLRRMRKYGVED